VFPDLFFFFLKIVRSSQPNIFPIFLKLVEKFQRKTNSSEKIKKKNEKKTTKVCVGEIQCSEISRKIIRETQFRHICALTIARNETFLLLWTQLLRTFSVCIFAEKNSQKNQQKIKNVKCKVIVLL
jgi:lysyl-tRNA synthetase class I